LEGLPIGVSIWNFAKPIYAEMYFFKTAERLNRVLGAIEMISVRSNVPLDPALGGMAALSSSPVVESRSWSQVEGLEIPPEGVDEGSNSWAR
jgi:hypothetical protein